MTESIQTIAEDLEEAEQLTSETDNPALANSFSRLVSPAVEQVFEDSRDQFTTDTRENGHTNVFVDRVQRANGHDTSLDAAISKRTSIQYQLKQKWEGYVIDVGQETFRARLTPIVGEPGEHIAAIYLDEVAKSERDLIKPGSIFYWSIGYRDSGSGRRRESFIRFQRLPERNQRELEAALRKGEELLHLFTSE